MHLMKPPERTLGDLATEWNTAHRVWNSDACQAEVNFLDDPEKPILKLGDYPVPLDEVSIAQLCAFYGIPSAFFGRLTRAEKHYLLNSRINYASGEVTVSYWHTGLIDIRKPGQPRLSAMHFIEAAEAVVPPQAKVLDAWCTADDLRIDILGVMPAEDGVVGGLRLMQNRKQNLAPQVAPLLYHQETTSILHITDYSLKIDARGLDADKIAELFSAEVLRADARLTHDIHALHSLRTAPVSPERLQRVAEEQGVPVRALAGIAAAMSATDEPTLFDLALAIANAANNPKLADPVHRGGRTKLQTIAGHIVTDHSERCDSCQALMAAAA